MAEQRKKLNRMRKLIGENMRQSNINNPKTSGFGLYDFTELLEMKQELEAAGRKVSDTVIFLKAIALTLKEYPAMNARLEGDECIVYDSINPGIAVDTPRGLITLTLRDTQDKSLMDLAEDFRALMHRMRDGKLTADDYTGSTYTISNLSRTSGGFFTSIINNNECFIIGFGGIHKQAMVLENDVIAARSVCYVTVNANHVLVDGVETGKFMERLREILEHPKRYM